MRFTNSRQRAMTLLEILIALGFTAIVMAMGTGLLTMGERWWRSQESQMTARRAAWSTVASVARDLRSAIPASEGAPVVIGSADTLQLTVPYGWNKDGIAVPGAVEYCIVKTDATEEALSSLARKMAPNAAELAQATDLNAKAGCTDLKFEYMGADGNWVDEWRNAAAPKLVRVTLTAILDQLAQPVIMEKITTTVTLSADSRVTR